MDLAPLLRESRTTIFSEALALEWVSLAGHHHAVQTLDLSALFR